MSDSPSPAAHDSGNAPVQLKDPWLAALLAFLWPGAGHLYQGRTGKGILFMVCILATFAYGQYLGAGRVVFLYGQWRPERFRLHYIAQVWVGLPAFPALLHRFRHPDPAANRLGPQWWYMPPSGLEDYNELHKVLHRYFELGSMFTVIAGLLNVLAIYDAFGGPAYVPEKSKEESESDEKQKAA